MTRLLDLVAQVAPSEATVLVTGESGTGKEMIAGAIHYNSPRKGGPFIRINCAAITETLLESELFGHEKGSFTGADRRKEGKFRQADRGTIFLDEVSEMSLGMQVKLLRVLQEREFSRVGGEEVIRVDVRVIAATNRDLLRTVTEGRFREDLYYRLNVVTLRVPPLRERREDIPLLAQHFLKIFAERNRKSLNGFTPRAMDRLLRYPWPGNVRELMNTIERGVVLCRADILDEGDVAPVLEAEQPPAPIGTDGISAAATGASLEDVEKTAILKTLGEAGGNKSEAARRLGITRRTLHLKLKKYGLM
jgi:two-component system response regulator HydG